VDEILHVVFIAKIERLSSRVTLPQLSRDEREALEQTR
jgi:hypothetical protein